MEETVERPGRSGPSLRIVWPLAVAGLVFAASSRSQVSGPSIEHFDKVVHFSVYGLLGTLVCRLGGGGRGALWSILAVSLFGVSDEWHQSFVPGRLAEVADWVADTLGAGVAVLTYTFCGPYRSWLERPVFPSCPPP